MFKRFSKWLKSLFSPKFIVPEVNKKLSMAIDDKIAKTKVKMEEERAKHDHILKEYLRTYFDREYSCEEDQEYSYLICNRGWKLHVKQVNSTNKLINLDKRAFERESKSFVLVNT